jgi:hypothetical protein
MIGRLGSHPKLNGHREFQSRAIGYRRAPSGVPRASCQRDERFTYPIGSHILDLWGSIERLKIHDNLSFLRECFGILARTQR